MQSLSLTATPPTFLPPPLSQGKETRDAAEDASTEAKKANGASLDTEAAAVEGASIKMAEEAGRDTAEEAKDAGLATDAGRKAKEAIKASGQNTAEKLPKMP